MKNSIQSLAKAGLLSAVIISLTGCVTKTVYVTQTPPAEPAPEPEVVQAPPPEPEPEPVQTSAVIRHESDFYEPLRPFGQWVFIASYGRCWRPSRIDAGWRPYSNGHWVRTEAGWFWESDEPWAWATYHYGRWDWTQAYGWIWVPQTQWAPAWVSWREGNGYVGWAPLPPAARITVSGHVEVHETIIAPRFVFVEERRMLEPVRPRTVIVNNQTVINKTVNITRIQVNNNQTVINEGPKTEVIEHATGKKVKEHPSHDLRDKGESKVAHKKNDPPGQQRRNDPPGQQKKTEPPGQAKKTEPPGQAKKTPAPDTTDSTRPPHDNRVPKTPAQAEAPRSTPLEANQPQTPSVAETKRPAPADVTPPQTPVETVKAQPIAIDEKTSEPKPEPVAAKPAHPAVEKPTHKGGKPEATPVAKKETKPEGNTHENQPAAKPAKPAKEQRPGTITVQAREMPSGEKKSNPANEQPEPNRTQVKSPKSNNAAHEPGASNSQKNQKNKKGESAETTENNSTSPSAQ